MFFGSWQSSALAETEPTDYNFAALIRPVPAAGKFYDPEYNIWCGSEVYGTNGDYHLFYSRWPRKLGHLAWVTHSEVAHAVSRTPFGPWVFHDVALPARGARYWDGSCTHNPTVLFLHGKYYLYYMGNYGDGVVKTPLNWLHRNHQRIGVAVADSPSGPWQRLDHPVLDTEPDMNAPDALLVTNPSVTERPDGGVLMIYKAVGMKRPLPFGGPVVHLAAVAKNPLGPFIKHNGSIFNVPGSNFAAEDPFLWHTADGYWAIIKDNNGVFTHRGYSLALWRSNDGFDWKLAHHPFVANPASIRWEVGNHAPLTALERPQVFFRAGHPLVLLCASADNARRDGTFNLQIPLANPE